jgi:hypothetical protein
MLWFARPAQLEDVLLKKATPQIRSHKRQLRPRCGVVISHGAYIETVQLTEVRQINALRQQTCP